MKITRSFHAPDRETWHAWLSKNGSREKEVWLIFDKKGSTRACIPYEDSVEEALCFGWIDSLIQKIDDQQYARKFTPRRPGSPWSDTNKQRVFKVLTEGRMTPAGRARIDFPLDKPPSTRQRKEVVLPEVLIVQLKGSSQAWKNYKALPPSQQQLYNHWIMEAKQDSTRQRRLQLAIQKLERNERLGISSPGIKEK